MSENMFYIDDVIKRLKALRREHGNCKIVICDADTEWDMSITKIDIDHKGFAVIDPYGYFGEDPIFNHEKETK